MEPCRCLPTFQWNTLSQSLGDKIAKYNIFVLRKHKCRKQKHYRHIRTGKIARGSRTQFVRPTRIYCIIYILFRELSIVLYLKITLVQELKIKNNKN
jgi:hypothetical protein